MERISQDVSEASCKLNFFEVQGLGLRNLQGIEFKKGVYLEILINSREINLLYTLFKGHVYNSLNSKKASIQNCETR